MDSVAVTVPLRPPTKKMKKRKELDALAAPHAVTRRNSGKRSSQELLTDSSDERSEYWSVSTRGGRKCRGSRRGRVCPGLLRACSAFLACASILATATLIWLFIDVRQQLGALRTELDQVSAGTAGMPESIQKCHSQSRDLLNNQTIIFASLDDVKLQIANFTAQLSTIQRGLHGVQETIQSAPELVNFPKNLMSLAAEVATLGSQIKDLETTVVSFKEANAKIQSVQNGLLQNVTTIEHSLAALANITQHPQAVLSNESRVEMESMRSKLSQLFANLTLVNATLSRDLMLATEDQSKDHKLLESLQETAQHVDTKVAWLSGECAKVADQTSIRDSVNKLLDEMERVKATDLEQTEKLKRLENFHDTAMNSSDAMQASLTKIKESGPSMTVQEIKTIQTVPAYEDPNVTRPTEASIGVTVERNGDGGGGAAGGGGATSEDSQGKISAAVESAGEVSEKESAGASDSA